VRIELLLDHSLRPGLLAHRLMPRLELNFAELTDSDDRNILDAFYDPQIALGHEYSLPQIARVWGGRPFDFAQGRLSPAAFDMDFEVQNPAALRMPAKLIQPNVNFKSGGRGRPPHTNPARLARKMPLW
jgi:hypothetical protein